MKPARRERGAWLTLIALFKAVKAAVLVAVGVGLLDPARAARAHSWLVGLAWTWDPRAAPAVMRGAAHLYGRHAFAYGVVALAYAVLFGVEGVGLWRVRPWGEWLTIVATGSLLPIEIYEIVRHATLPRIVALVLNLLVVGYLVWRVRQQQRA